MLQKKTKKIVIILGLVLLLAVGFAGGYWFAQNRQLALISTGGKVTNQETLPSFLTKDVNFDEFWQVWQYVKSNYVKANIPDTQLFYGAMSGIVASLGDPYSVFFDPKINSQFTEELSGNFEGVGAEIGIRSEQLVIIAPLPGTPAAKAGLKAGDQIISIDDVSTAGLALDAAVNKIRGPQGTKVTLTIIGQGAKEPSKIDLIREKIKIDSVRIAAADGTPIIGEPKLLSGDIAYIQLLYFNENTLADWNKNVQAILALKPKGIILDLRNNPGGFLTTAIEVAGEWVDGKTVVKEQLRSGEKIGHTAQRQALFAGIPTVVLINQGSASGSEIVAGALQDYRAAKLVGQTTFGKGSVQDLKQFADGSSVKLTIAEWLTPLDRNINQQGIKPDVAVEITVEDIDKKIDPQLNKAIEILKH